MTPVTSLFVDVTSNTSFVDQGSSGVSRELVENLGPVGMREINRASSLGVVEGGLNTSAIFVNLAHHLLESEKAYSIQILYVLFNSQHAFIW